MTPHEGTRCQMAATHDIHQLVARGDPELSRLLACCPDIEALCFRDQERLVTEDEDGNDVFLVLAGSLVIEQKNSRQPEGPPTVLATVSGTPTAPAFVGAMSYFSEGLRSASVRTAGCVHALRLRPQHLDAIIDRLPGLTRRLCGHLCRCIREGNRKIRAYEDLLAMKMRPVFAPPGTIVFRRGDPTDSLYQCVYGQLRLENDQGTRRITAGAADGGFIEHKSFFLDSAYRATLTAEAASMLVAFAGDAREQIVRNFPRLALDIIDAAKSSA